MKTGVVRYCLKAVDIVSAFPSRPTPEQCEEWLSRRVGPCHILESRADPYEKTVSVKLLVYYPEWADLNNQ